MTAVSLDLRSEVEAITREIDDAQRGGGFASPDLWARYNEALTRVGNAVGLDVVRDAPEIYQGDFTLRRAQVNPLTLQVVYTQDGLPIADPLTWAEDTGSESVYYERYSLASGARLSHGWVSVNSRRLLQSG